MSFSQEEVERYARHLVLREIGGPGQQKLKAASVAIVGAGGLGAPSALYLAAAGIGRIVLIDHDIVSLSNLQRQILYEVEDIRAPKVEVAARRLRGMNPNVEIDPTSLELTLENAPALIGGVDLVLDGTDNFPTRFIVNQACVETGRILVSGAIGRWTGQVAVFGGKPCYRCLVSEAPPDAETCSAVGVVGALAGVIGSMMALEAVKVITGAGDALTGRLLIYDGLAGEARTVRIGADPGCEVCGGK